jgi:ribonuclease HI
LEWNLTANDIGTTPWPWNLFFGVALNLLWKDRNSQVDQIHNAHHYQQQNIQSNSITTTWIKPQPGVFKVNVDGAHSSLNGTSTCGGLIRDHHGRLIKGFFSKVSSSSSLFAEMWALHSGILVARDLGLNRVVFETDSLTLFNMVKKGHTNFTPLILLLKDISILLHRTDWTSSICFSPRETNRCAHMLAQCGFSSSFNINILENITPLLNSLLMYDAEDSTSQLFFS